MSGNGNGAASMAAAAEALKGLSGEQARALLVQMTGTSSANSGAKDTSSYASATASSGGGGGGGGHNGYGTPRGGGYGHSHGGGGRGRGGGRGGWKMTGSGTYYPRKNYNANYDYNYNGNYNNNNQYNQYNRGWNKWNNGGRGRGGGSRGGRGGGNGDQNKRTREEVSPVDHNTTAKSRQRQDSAGSYTPATDRLNQKRKETEAVQQANGEGGEKGGKDERRLTTLQARVKDVAGKSEEGYEPEKTLHSSAYKDIKEFLTPVVRKPILNQCCTGAVMTKPRAYGTGTQAITDMKEELEGLKKIVNQNAHVANYNTAASEFVGLSFEAYTEAAEKREVWKAEREIEMMKMITRKIADLERQYSKQCVVLSGTAIPVRSPKGADPALEIAMDLIWRKWGIEIDPQDVAVAHRTGNRNIVMRFLDMKDNSAFNKLTMRKGNWVGDPNIHLEARIRLAALDAESFNMLKFIKEVDGVNSLEQARVARFDQTPAGFVRFKTGAQISEERADKQVITSWIWVAHPDDLLAMFKNSTEMALYRERHHATGLPGIVSTYEGKKKTEKKENKGDEKKGEGKEVEVPMEQDKEENKNKQPEG